MDVPFKNNMILKVEEVKESFYSLMCLSDDGLIRAPETWVKLLFYKHEPSFYGTTIKTNERHVVLSLAQLLDLFSPRYVNPFIRMHASGPNSFSILDSFYRLQPAWQDQNIWQHISFDDVTDAMQIQLPDLNEDDARMLTIAIQQQLQQHGLTVAEAKTLKSFFEKGGWPLQTERQLNGPAKIAFRFSEPT